MILFESPLIRLDYAPATDILTADLSATYEFYYLEVREALNTLVNAVRHYDVKRLLMDSRKRIVQIEEEKYTALMREFVLGLQTTRLEKLARLHTGNPSRENIAKTLQAEVSHFVMATFTEKEPALTWLKNK
jgi:hypothetical protein